MPKLPYKFRAIEFIPKDTNNHYANAVKLCAKRNGKKWKYNSRSWASSYAKAHWKLALQIRIEENKRRKEFASLDMTDFEFDSYPFETHIEKHVLE